VFCADFIERRIQSEIVAALFAVGLVPFEIMDRGSNRIAGPFVRTDGMDDMPNHPQGLKRNHRFVIFHIIAHQHENFLDRHDERFSPEVHRRIFWRAWGWVVTHDAAANPAANPRHDDFSLMWIAEAKGVGGPLPDCSCQGLFSIL
jgi:hypothetical protein